MTPDSSSFLYCQQRPPYGYEQNDRNYHHARVRYRRGPYDAVNTLEFVHDELKRYIVTGYFRAEKQPAASLPAFIFRGA